jgi:dUTPase-like protein
MNIDDVKDVPEVITLDMVFEEQHKLAAKYRDIEKRPNVNLDTRDGQQVVKDFLWRIVEEIGEALDSNLGPDHQREELADAFHFLVELSIITGREAHVKQLIERWAITNVKRGPFEPALMKFLVMAARVGRVCKNKPWKQTQIPMDQYSFTQAMTDLTLHYLNICEFYFTSNDHLFQFYFRKSQVNKFRQRSGY